MAGLAVVVISPVSLVLLNALDLPWERLSAIGQAYTGPAALLSAIALAGLTLTVYLQRQQTAVEKQAAVRYMQFELLKYALENRDARKLLQADSESEESDVAFTRRMFRIMALRYLQFAYSIGELDDVALASALSLELDFQSDDREWWRLRGRETWRRAALNLREKQFFSKLDEHMQAHGGESDD